MVRATLWIGATSTPALETGPRDAGEGEGRREGSDTNCNTWQVTATHTHTHTHTHTRMWTPHTQRQKCKRLCARIGQWRWWGWWGYLGEMACKRCQKCLAHTVSINLYSEHPISTILKMLAFTVPSKAFSALTAILALFSESYLWAQLTNNSSQTTHFVLTFPK